MPAAYSTDKRSKKAPKQKTEAEVVENDVPFSSLFTKKGFGEGEVGEEAGNDRDVPERSDRRVPISLKDDEPESQGAFDEDDANYYDDERRSRDSRHFQASTESGQPQCNRRSRFLGP